MEFDPTTIVDRPTPETPKHENPWQRFYFYYKTIFSESEHWIKVVTIWFIVGGILGVIIFFTVPNVTKEIMTVFADKFGSEPPLNMDLAWAIFLNNVKASGIALFGGLLVGVGPFIVVMTNAFILGYILAAVIAISPDNLVHSIMLMIVGIVPHGILEIPAFLFSAALGLKLGIDWLKKENYGKRVAVFKHNFKYILFGGIPAVLLMLFAAALLEVFVSGRLLEGLF